MGRQYSAIAMLVTLGGFFIGFGIDGFLISMNKIKDDEGNYLREGGEPYFRGYTYYMRAL